MMDFRLFPNLECTYHLSEGAQILSPVDQTDQTFSKRVYLIRPLWYNEVCRAHGDLYNAVRSAAVMFI